MTGMRDSARTLTLRGDDATGGATRAVRLRFVSGAGLSHGDEEGIRGRFVKIHPKLGGVEFERVEAGVTCLSVLLP